MSIFNGFLKQIARGDNVIINTLVDYLLTITTKGHQNIPGCFTYILI